MRVSLNVMIVVIVCVSACARPRGTSTPIDRRGIARGMFAVGAMFATISALEANASLASQRNADELPANSEYARAELIELTRTQRRYSLLAGTAALVTTGAALFVREAEPAPRPPKGKRKWYGWKLALADGVAAGFAAVGAVSLAIPGTPEERGIGRLATASALMFVAPVLHLAEGELEHALESVAMRGTSTYFAWHDGRSSSRLLQGLAAAAVGASVIIDDAILARRNVDARIVVAPVAGGGLVSWARRF
ncbi:MAG: hypothetical protein KF773_17250 [Deltaproteobacteria bacterium]|nr:hypothetical protein [Deltaproteobacteria bacterium]